ncbi:MAG: hypothetical protein ACK442_14700 [Novosphingobium sp.]|jgi:hypothetical protein|nr:hypothetical protein [Brevundimonas sp.]MCZ8322017.1 hypothetical protein [Novosphingobium sp.]
MVDYFALALSHSLLVFAAWRLLWRDDLDADPAAPEQDPPGGSAPQATATLPLRTRASENQGLRIRA